MWSWIWTVGLCNPNSKGDNPIFKLNTSFDVEKKSLADEKTLLIQHAETTEAALKEITTELTGLKNRVSQMVSTIFDDSLYYLLKIYFCHKYKPPA